MSKSIRLSDELFERAKESGSLFHRSPPQQVEHWAQIGRVMESALSYRAVKSAKAWGSQEDIDELVDEVSSPEGKAGARNVIRHNSHGELYEADSKDPMKVRKYRPGKTL